jgi:hypothetical protein
LFTAEQQLVRGSRPFGFTSITHATIAVVLLLRAVAFAQDVTEPALKAAFIYNFARFTTWPTELPPAEPFVICVLGDPAVGDALQRTVAGRLFDEHPIVVTRVAASAPKRACRVLYSAGLPTGQATEVVNELQDAPVLTLSNIDGFASAGGMAQFFFEHGQLRFRITAESARRAGLQISSRLLVMARPQR